MERRIRTDIPTAKTLLTPQWPYLAEFQEQDREYKAKQKQNYDQQHRTQTLNPLPPDTPVWITTGRDHTFGQVCSPAETHCSAQDNGWRLVGHSLKMDYHWLLHWKCTSYQIGLARSYTKVGQKKTCDRPLFCALHCVDTRRRS